MKTILVTGGSNGIGKAISEHLLKSGHTVVIADMDEATGLQISHRYPNECLFINTDLRMIDGVMTLFEQLDAQQINLDAIINNAGKGMVTPLPQLTDEEIEDGYGLMLRAPLLISREWIKRRKPSTSRMYGRIINIASTRAIMSEPSGQKSMPCVKEVWFPLPMPWQTHFNLITFKSIAFLRDGSLQPTSH
jgi:NAD(P)-dependent dehydrogenase (short-subunit alcohol dehydrogenase family)